jgi:predicted enzyme related to lactoylglutathione lyase
MITRSWRTRRQSNVGQRDQPAALEHRAVLHVDDVVTTANYYRDKLGFQYERFWGEPPCFCMVYRSGIVIMLAQLEKTGVMRPNRIVDPEGGAWDAYIWNENADALHAEFKSKGVKIVRGICDQPTACRDFDVEDCNGYRLCFGQNLEG